MAENSHNFRLEEPTPPTDNSRIRTAAVLAIIGALAIVLALIGIDVAVISAAQRPAPRPVVHKQVVRVNGTVQVASTVYLSVSPGIKPGPDGKLHDAFSVTSFNVHGASR